MYNFKGFSAVIEKKENGWIGKVIGLNIEFKADTEENAVSEFHRIAEEHMPISD